MPQLLAPLELTFCAASLCQDIRRESPLTMRDVVGEHMAPVLGPFLRAASLPILQIPRSLPVDFPLQLIPQIIFGVSVGGGTVMAM